MSKRADIIAIGAMLIIFLAASRLIIATTSLWVGLLVTICTIAFASVVSVPAARRAHLDRSRTKEPIENPRTDQENFDEIWNLVSSQVNLVELIGDLQTLRVAMRERASEPEQDLAIGEVANAQIAASNGDGPQVISHLAQAGAWALSIAITAGTAVAAAAIQVTIQRMAATRAISVGVNAGDSGTTSAATAQAGGKVRGPTLRSLGIALIAMATAQYMILSNMTAIVVALPTIQRALKFSGPKLEWVVIAYALTLGGLLLATHRAGQVFGRRRVFIVGLILFSAASLIGGLAISQLWLVTARALQGIGSAMIATNVLSLIFNNSQKRSRAARFSVSTV